MVKKLFALASITGLTGLVTAITAAGCSSTEVVQGGSPDATTDAPKTTPKDTGTPVDTDEPAEPSCKAKDVTFTATPINPPAAQTKTACSDAVIDALATACLEDPASTKDTKCKDARAVAANKTCVDCVFGTKTDTEWKVINIEEGKSAQFNQAGCIDHITTVPGCGGAYITILRCANTFCPQGEGKCDQTTGTACFNEIKEAECKNYLLGNKVSSDDQACSNALQAKDPQISDNCFAADNTAAAEKTFFVNMVKTSCQSDPGGSKDSG
jgi:hypothetical protein